MLHTLAMLVRRGLTCLRRQTPRLVEEARRCLWGSTKPRHVLSKFLLAVLSQSWWFTASMLQRLHLGFWVHKRQRTLPCLWILADLTYGLATTMSVVIVLLKELIMPFLLSFCLAPAWLSQPTPQPLCGQHYFLESKSLPVTCWSHFHLRAEHTCSYMREK